MALVVPNASEVTILEYVLNKGAPEELDMRLYTNDHTPAETDVVSTYTEATGGGYVVKNLNAASWVITPGNPSASEHPQVTWIFTGIVGNVYGYYITRRTTGDLMWAERFTNGPYNIQTNNDQIRVTPRLTLE